MARPRTCGYCGHTARTTTEHAIHLADAHSDRIGVGVGAPAARSRRTWSCWHCATETPGTQGTCTNCGWTHPYTPPTPVNS